MVSGWYRLRQPMFPYSPWSLPITLSSMYLKNVYLSLLNICSVITENWIAFKIFLILVFLLPGSIHRQVMKITPIFLLLFELFFEIHWSAIFVVNYRIKTWVKRRDEINTFITRHGCTLVLSPSTFICSNLTNYCRHIIENLSHLNCD